MTTVDFLLTQPNLCLNMPVFFLSTTRAEELSNKNQLDFMHFFKLVKMGFWRNLDASLPLLKVFIASKRFKTEFLTWNALPYIIFLIYSKYFLWYSFMLKTIFRFASRHAWLYMPLTIHAYIHTQAHIQDLVVFFVGNKTSFFFLDVPCHFNVYLENLKLWK